VERREKTMNDLLTGIQSVTARPNIEVHLPEGRVLSGPRNTTIGSFMKQVPGSENPLVVGAIVNGELRELTYQIEMDAKVKPVTMTDADGARIYRRSLVFLLESAFEELFPKVDLGIDHSVSSGGFYCHVIGREPLADEELTQLNNTMNSLVKDDLPFERQQIPLEEAIAYFKAQGHEDKVRLLSYRQKEHLILYRLGTHRDYYHGYMVPSTSYLRWFGLTPMGNGFVLRYPRRSAPDELLPMPNYPKLLQAFREYGDWLQRLGIESVGALNDAISAGRIAEVILVSEGLHEQQVAKVAAQIAEKREEVKLVLISGPSSSGKTTFSKRLAVQLLVQGLSPFALEMDNYFVDRELTPLDEIGERDFEALGTLDRFLLGNHLHLLISGEKVQLPRYNFKEGKRELGDTVQLKSDQLIILEGIHGLNPDLLPSFAPEQTYRIYVSCLTQLNLDKHNRISTTDTRLLRRIVRDAHTRGYTAQQTISRWESVRRGEKRHIFPYQENANVMFNSALVYELTALKPEVEPLLRQVPYGVPEYVEAKRLLAFLEWFLPVGQDWIPGNSILREFIGGSFLKDFKLWQEN
jgi:uridine kinase